MNSVFDWRTGPSIFAPPAKCTASQASEIAASKRPMKKPGRPVDLPRSLDRATKPKGTWGGAQPNAGRHALVLDVEAMRAFRVTGKTWRQVAEQFHVSTFTARMRCAG